MPDSLVTNSATRLNEVFRSYEKVLVKGIGFGNLPIVRQPGIVEAFSPFAELYDREHFAHRLEEHDCPPMMVQEYFEREFDLRVSVIGDEVHAARIEKPAGLVDSRRLGVDQSFDFVDLPSKVIEQIREFMTRMQLSFGHMDFVQLQNNELVFLECNPEGIWAFYDEKNRISAS